MTLQQHKEKEARRFLDVNSKFVRSFPLLANNKAFISGFDAADPITFLEFVVLNNYFCNDSDKNNITWSKNDIEEPMTTEQLYLLFIEYKQKQQAQ